MARVLLIEDNLDLLNVLKQVVELAGHTVIAAGTGSEGRSALFDGSAPPDVVVCDMSLPDMNGLELLRELRAAAHLKSVYFIAISGDDEDQPLARRAGADAYLSKPFSINLLTTLVEQRSGDDSPQ